MNTLAPHAVAALTFGALLVVSPHAAGQATVPHTPPVWADFGTTNITGVAGNFLPGWTTLTGSPDLGNNLFFVPTTSLTGASDDAALWFLKFDQTSPAFGSNEAAELSLSGFTPGVQYRLDFFATIVLSTFVGWNSEMDDLQVSIVGANISMFSTSVLTDVGNHDGVNDWVPQSIVFTALNPIVAFRFNDAPVSVDPTLVGRIGIDGMRMTVVPAPGAAALAVFVVVGGRRRRRD